MRYALLIATSRYRELDDLPSAHVDMRRVERVLSDFGSFDHIERVVDADEAEIRRQLEDVFADRRRDDLVLVYFSCHGKLDARGRLYFAAHTTKKERLGSTAVPVETLIQHLQDTRAGSTVALLDCCYSGSFAEGFAARGEDQDSVAEQVRSRGSYVITASGKGEYAFERDSGGDAAQPSVFTRALCDGLLGAAPDLDGDGWIDAAELDRYLQDEVHKAANQAPMSFSEGVQGKLALTQVSSTAQPVGSQRAAQATGGDAARRGERETTKPQEGGAQTERGAQHKPISGPEATLDSNGWRRLLNYYADCVEREATLSELVPVEKDGSLYTTQLGDSESMLTGEAATQPASGPALKIAREAVRNGHHLRYGFPAVVVRAQQGDGGARRGESWRVAPLLVVDIALEEDPEQPALRLAGEVELNQGLVREVVSGVSEAELEDLKAWFKADWGRGDVSQLGSKVRSLLRILDIRPVSEVAPGSLETELALRPLREGAQNAAMLYFVGATGTTGRLLGDLRGTTNAMEAADIPGTALGALDRPTAAAATEDERRFDVVAAGQLNEAQERVLSAAMRRRLTVATGPPGTGKSQLVTSLVATAVSAGQSVLVASTNNTPVDEVVDRANQLVPDLIVRTGNKDYQRREPTILRRILAQAGGKPDTTTPRTRVQTWQQKVEAAQAELDRRAGVERELARVAAARHHWADRVGWKLPELPAALADERGLNRWSRRADRAVRLGRLGFWHRRRLRSGLGASTDGDSLEVLRQLLQAEVEWRSLRRREESLVAASEAWNDLGAATENRREHSKTYLRARAVEAWSASRDAIRQRIEALSSGNEPSSWKRFRPVLRPVRAWATTSLSARAFPPGPAMFDLVVVDEASQCSIPEVLPLLYRARRALVIGDPNQLQHITTLPGEQETGYRHETGLSDGWMEDRRLGYREYSAYHAFAAAAEETLWLDEHYRCHPEIIEIANRHFYGDRLAVLTDPTSLAVRQKYPVSWVDMAGEAEQPPAGSWRNDAEARRVSDLVRDLDERLPEAVSIGVITPFAGQRALIDKYLGQAGLGREPHVGTIHTFQGRECDFIVLSPVATPEIRPGTLRWLLSQTNLWNVAITRARCALYAVGHRAFWSRQQGPLREVMRAADGEPEPTGPPPGGADAKQGLYRELELAGVDFRAAPLYEGYQCDAVLDTPQGSLVVLIDHADAGNDADEEPGRAARQLLNRCAVLQQAGAAEAVRVPAWRCIDEPEQVVAELLNRPQSQT